jgi:hypothetical protein
MATIGHTGSEVLVGRCAPGCRGVAAPVVLLTTGDGSAVLEDSDAGFWGCLGDWKRVDVVKVRGSGLL